MHYCVSPTHWKLLISMVFWRRQYHKLPLALSLSNLGGSVVKNLCVNKGDTGDSGLIPGSGRSPAEGNGNPLQYSCLENPMDRGAWQATVHGVAQNRTQLKWLSTAQVKYMFNFIRSCQTCFQSDYSILYSRKQCMWVPLVPQPHSHLVLAVFLILNILVGVT